MALDDLNDRAAVLAAAAEYDRLGRTAFLAKYGFRRARDYFLQIGERHYDSKAIVGVAHGHQFPSVGPLKAADFSGGAATVQRKLENMGFVIASAADRKVDVSDDPRKRVSGLLKAGNNYSRKDLQSILSTQDATLNTGVFQPSGYDSVLLFVTEKKTPDRVQYVDKLEGDTLHWQGQNSGRTDGKIIGHRAHGLELLLFYRTKKYEHEGAAFTYEGLFDYVSHEGSQPASFTLTRARTEAIRAELNAEAEAELQLEDGGAFDPTSIEDARRKTFALIVMRQGQPAFRKKLLEAYDRRCALTECSVEQVLEAAHICRYMGAKTNVVQNGLLLRADLHALYDRALIAIDPGTLEVCVAPALKGSDYDTLSGRTLRLPKSPQLKPSAEALLTHWMLVRSVWEN